MIMTYNDRRQWYGVGACKRCTICVIDNNIKIKLNISKYDEIKIIFK